MGCNYYLVNKHEEKELEHATNIIKSLNEVFTNLTIEVPELKMKHIGKSSYERRFIFDTRFFNGLDDFKRKYSPEDYIITNEYNEILPYYEFNQIVEGSLESDLEIETGMTITPDGYRGLDREFY